MDACAVEMLWWGTWSCLAWSNGMVAVEAGKSSAITEFLMEQRKSVLQKCMLCCPNYRPKMWFRIERRTFLHGKLSWNCLVSFLSLLLYYRIKFTQLNTS